MLRVIRQNSGFKQGRVATMLGYKNATLLSLWENEIAMPSSTNLMNLCIIYKKHPEDLYPEYYGRLAQRLYDRDLL